jgi:osmotically-inducible protein OsmY
MELLVQADTAVMPSSAVSSHVDSAVADVELQRRVRNFLLSRRVPRTSRLRIDAHGGVVTLHGTHRSFYHKQLCINCCLRVAGVVRLVDATRVAADS